MLSGKHWPWVTHNHNQVGGTCGQGLVAPGGSWCLQGGGQNLGVGCGYEPEGDKHHEHHDRQHVGLEDPGVLHPRPSRGERSQKWRMPQGQMVKTSDAQKPGGQQVAASRWRTQYEATVKGPADSPVAVPGNAQ